MRAVVLVKCLNGVQKEREAKKGSKNTVLCWCACGVMPSGSSSALFRDVDLCIIWKCKVSRIESEMEVSGLRKGI